MSSELEIVGRYKGEERPMPENREAFQDLLDVVFPDGASVVVAREDEALFSADYQFSYAALFAEADNEIRTYTQETDSPLRFRIKRMWRLPSNRVGVRFLVMEVEGFSGFTVLMLTSNVGSESAAWNRKVRGP